MLSEFTGVLDEQNESDEPYNNSSVALYADYLRFMELDDEARKAECETAETELNRLRKISQAEQNARMYPITHAPQGVN